MTKRRDKGTGTIYADPSRGGYRGKITIDGKEYVRRGKTKAEVKDRLNALTRDHATGQLVRDQRLTVAAVVDHYLTRVVPNRKSGRLSKGALGRYRWAAAHITEEIGKVRVANLTTPKVEAMLDRLADPAGKDLARDSIKKIAGMLTAALEVAVSRGDIPRNVARHAALPAETKDERVRYSLTEDMAGRLLACVDDERNGAMYALMVYLGTRPGEAAGLYWSDLNLDDDTVNFTRARKTDDRGHASIEDGLKTATANRTVTMPEQLAGMLRRHRTQQAAERLAAPTWVDDRLVFATTVGTPLAATAVRRHLADLCRRHGVTVDDEQRGPRPPVPYELRHTGITLLAERGLPAETIARITGTSVRMIEQRYRHWLKPTIDAARDVWSTPAAAER